MNLSDLVSLWHVVILPPSHQGSKVHKALPAEILNCLLSLLAISVTSACTSIPTGYPTPTNAADTFLMRKRQGNDILYTDLQKQ